MRVEELRTPALIADADGLEHNLAVMAEALPGERLRPHVKAHKCTALAHRQAEAGHRGFTCATIREMEVMARAGLGHDLLLANEVLDTGRLGALVEEGHRITVAVDSDETVNAAAAGGVREVVIDVNVGLPRCGSPAEGAGALAERAREKGLAVRGVMGYEGHVMVVEDRQTRIDMTAECMKVLLSAAEAVGGELISAGGTGTYDINTWATEIQAGSYVLLDTAYAKLGLPFRLALSVEATVISVSDGWAVADCGLKSLGMDHGDPSIEGSDVWFCSDEHVTFSPTDGGSLPRVGDRVSVLPAHIDPTIAYHEAIHVVRDGEVLESWPVDMRGW